MTDLHIDVETYSELDLKKVGMYRYASDPSFQLLMASYAFDDDPVSIWTELDGPMPVDVVDALYSDGVTKYAHNAAFEITTLEAHLAPWADSLIPEQWRCTMVWAAELGLPRSLDALAKYLGVAQKDSEGQRLIRFFCRPISTGTKKGQRRRPEDHPEEWASFIEYCRQDTVVERQISRRLADHPMIGAEWDLWHVDQAINRRGLRVDTKLARNAVEIDHAQTSDRHEEMRQLTGLDNPNSVAQLNDWLLSNDCLMPDLRQETIRTVLGNGRPDRRGEVTRVLSLRLENASKSTSKYSAALATCSPEDHRIRGLHQFYGADTGRWAGRLVQVQNLPRPQTKACAAPREHDEGCSCQMDALRHRLEVKDFTLRSDELKDLIRTTFVPAPGNEFVVADFSAIEARVLAWLAGEEWVLDVFRSHGMIYEATAAAMLHKDISEITSEDRFRGKVATLALGYQGSVGAMLRMGAVEMGMDPDELPAVVSQWRRTHPRTVRLWADVERAARIRGASTAGHGDSGITLWHEDSGTHGCTLVVLLPSGRALRYPQWRTSTDDDGRTRSTYLDTTKGCRVDTYGGKLVENIVQAVARDLLGEALVSLETIGHDVVAHVHDEVVVEAPVGSLAVSDVVDVVTVVPSWAAGLPLAAEGFTTQYYRKG